jgi:hypothetical protein
VLDLRPLAQEICRRYRYEFPDEQARYGDAGMAWCVHDNQHLLNWAVAESNGYGGLELRLMWLAGVLSSSRSSQRRPATPNSAAHGDSGGPHFLAGTNVVVSITVTGDRFCRASDVTYRLDTPWARDFLAQYVSVP